MSRLGVFSFLGRGHLNPAAALARALRARGHEVIMFHLRVAEAAVRAAGLPFQAIDRSSRSQMVPDRVVGTDCRTTGDVILARTIQVLQEAPEIVKDSLLDGLVVDQLDIAVGTIADILQIPFVTLGCGPPIFLSPDTPAPYFYWRNPDTARGRQRNEIGNTIIRAAVAPALSAINQHRRRWGLEALIDLNDAFSSRAIITQMPEILDLPRRIAVPQLRYTGHLADGYAKSDLAFPWSRLSGKPIVYGSLGTIRNNVPDVFRIIASACASFDVQLVLSLGGGEVLSESLSGLANNVIVVHSAPQTEVIQRAVLTINCAGANTTLDSIAAGVPILAIPIAEDQPGVAVRINESGIGLSIPLHRLSTSALRAGIREVLDNPKYAEKTVLLRRHLQSINGPVSAAEIVESHLG